jgi:sn-glycerol 3-phosphate transport system substrate-binding protein
VTGPGRVPVDVWVADLTFPGYLDRLHRLADEFNRAHPGYRVNLTGHDFRRLPREIAEAAAAGRPPAVAEYYFYLTPVARDTVRPDGTPLFTSVERAVGGRTEILGEPVVLADIIPAVREFYSHDGELFSMPAVATAMLLYANMSVLRAAGVARLPETWGEVEAACERVAALPDGPGHGITWANHGLFFQQAVAVQGGLLADHRNGRAGPASTVHLDSPEMLAWAHWWQRLHQRGHYLYTGKVPDWEGTFRAFATGAVAMRITSSNDHDYMVTAAGQAGFEIATGRFPRRDGHPYAGNITAGTSLWLATGLDRATQDGALAFLQFLNNPANAAHRHRANSFLPVTGESFRLLEREGWFARHPYHRVASDQLASYPDGDPAGPPPLLGALFGDFAGVQDVMTRAMADVLVRGLDPAVRLADATVEARRLLADYHADCLGTGPRGPNSLRVEYFAGAEEYSGADLENVAALHRQPAGTDRQG